MELCVAGKLHDNLRLHVTAGRLNSSPTLPKALNLCHRYACSRQCLHSSGAARMQKVLGHTESMRTKWRKLGNL